MATASQKFEAAAQAALCDMLSAVGSGAATYAAWGLLTPGPFDEWAALGIAGLAGLAYSTGCQWDSENNTGTPLPWTPGCQKTNIGCRLYRLNTDTGGDLAWVEPNAVEIVRQYQNSYGITACDYIRGDGALITATAPFPNGYWYLDPSSSGATCELPIPPQGIEPTPPYVYTDPDDGCQINVTFQGWAVGADGTTGAAWKMEPEPTVRSSGGIIGGCNFSPILYYQPPGGGGGGGGGFDAPWYEGPDGPDGEPWWVDVIRSMGAGIAAAAANQLLQALFAEKVGAKVYRLVSVCETDSQGEPISQSREVDIPTLDYNQAVIYRLDALEYLLQGLKDFRQPICKGGTTQGDSVTVNFRSEVNSVNGDRPLRKTFGYRDLMNSDLAAHTAHWENFVWEAGPYIVKHHGADWGELQVWAESPDEGKRVIRHAGIIAGVNPDAEGTWRIQMTSDPRYGQPGTMRLAQHKSSQGMVLEISKRTGPSGLPIVPIDKVL